MGREKLLSGVQVWGLSDCEGDVSAIRNGVGHLMHMVAWMSLHKHRGIRFNSAGNKIFYATVDASNKQDPKNGLCHYGMDIMAAGGPLLSHRGQLKNTGNRAPVQEFMALTEVCGHLSKRWTCGSDSSCTRAVHLRPSTRCGLP